jgi:hypothetical protein
VGVTDARALEKTALFQDTGKTAAALGALPRVADKRAPIERRETRDEVLLQVPQKMLDG